MLAPPRPRSPCADRKYWATYKVLDILQKVFYRSNPAREAFVEMCESNYVQKMTFDSYLYKTGEPSHGPRARPPAGPAPPRPPCHGLHLPAPWLSALWRPAAAPP